MYTDLNIFSIIYIIGTFQGLLLSFVLLTSQKGNRTSNRVLALFLTLTSIEIFYFTLSSINFFESFPHLFFIKAHIFFLLGPLFYFFVKSFTSINFKFHFKDIIHFIPFIVFFIIILPFYFQDHESMLEVVKSSKNFRTVQISIEDLIIQGILKSYILFYFLFSLRLLNEFDKKTKNDSLYDKNEKYSWLKKTIITALVIITISIIIDFFPNRIPVDIFTPLAITFTILFMGYVGLKQSEILLIMELKRSERKYKKSALTSEMSENIYQNLIKLMSTDKIFLDREISLPKLAKEMNVAPNHLSQVINEKFSQNFFNFVNKFRIEEAKKLLKDKSNNGMNVSEIAYHVGFNSISAFNSAFKKFTDVSPTQFKNQKTNKIY